MRVLIVDDDPVDREDVKRKLQRGTECEVACAATASEALAAARHQVFDVILLDYRLPGRDGIEVLLELRSEADAAVTAVVMMSTVETEELALQCLRAGAQDFLVKSEISATKLRRAILHAQTRYELEHRLRLNHQSMKDLAEKDSLTGLANRMLFDQTLRVAISAAKRRRRKAALLLLDLDNFKHINDTHGHEVGDALLASLASRLEQAFPHQDLLARLGGDEFAVIVSDLADTDLRDVTVRLLSAVSETREVNGIRVDLTGSVGVAVYPGDASDATEAFRFADIAMYRAKRRGGNQVCFFEARMQEDLLRKLELERRISSGLDSGEFQVYYQPQVCSESLQVCGVEALSRWHYRGDVLLPREFVPAAEGSDQILELGRAALQGAIADLARWRTQDPALRLGINLSVRQLNDHGLPDFVEHLLGLYGVAADAVEFELTETALLDPNKHRIGMLDHLHELGCRLALDDFGVGYSSISHLHQFPLHTVKIDRSLMPGPQNQGRTERLLRGLVAMVQSLGLETVAEGVETEDQYGLCRELGVGRLQGFFFSEALPATKVRPLFRDVA